MLLCSQFSKETPAALGSFPSRFGSQSQSLCGGQAAAPVLRSCPSDIPPLRSRKAGARTSPHIDPSAFPYLPSRRSPRGPRGLRARSPRGLLQAAGGCRWGVGSGIRLPSFPAPPGPSWGACLNAQTWPPLPGLQEGQLGLFLLEARPLCVCGLSWFSDLSPGALS